MELGGGEGPAMAGGVPVAELQAGPACLLQVFPRSTEPGLGGNLCSWLPKGDAGPKVKLCQVPKPPGARSSVRVPRGPRLHSRGGVS